jgi:hypothetical protein
MPVSEITGIVAQAKHIYDTQLRTMLEEQYRDQYVAIEPQSGDYFLGTTLEAAVRTARQHYPERLCHTIRIGHEAAFHIGWVTQ